jgi:acetylornithine deacetylase/succinyl-diaminopimelate desuccinylase-like protein
MDEAVALLRELLRVNTSNPPGNETAAQRLLVAPLREAGFDAELVGPDPERLNLVAQLRGREPGPVLGLLSHVDTVTADPRGWAHDPWSGALADGCVWGRGALDMKSQTAAEVVAACTLAREGWRPAKGDLLVISVADEEVDGTGAAWVCAERPDLVRCDYLLNEGSGVALDMNGERIYEVSTSEKGVFRFTLVTDGTAGHASVPDGADNALLKLAPLLDALTIEQTGWRLTPSSRAYLTGLGVEVDDDAEAALSALRERSPELARFTEPMLRVTLAPTMVEGSRAMNVIPDEARLHVDCRVPPGMDEADVLRQITEVLPPDGYRLEFTERVVGSESPPESKLMDALREWVATTDPGARCLPSMSTGYTDSHAFRAAFPECIAYGFFPQRHMTADEVESLEHARNERIDVRDLALAVDCYRSVTRSLLG